MIVKIKLVCSDDAVLLPKSYNHILQAFFYNNMEDYMARFLHDLGFVYGKRKFKLFTFSKIIAKLMKRTKNLLIFDKNLTVYFASPLVDILNSYVKTIVRKEKLTLGKNRLYLESVESIKPREGNEIVVKAISPITVYRTPEGSKYFHYFSPFEEEFYKLLKENLLKKYNIIYGKPYEGDIAIEPVKIKKSYRKKIVFKKTLIEAWEGIFKIRATSDMVRLVQEAGLGSKNSAGFGMVIAVPFA